LAGLVFFQSVGTNSDPFYRKNQDVVAYLLNSGFQANQKDIHGRTPLFIAAINVVENPDRHSKGMLQTLLQNHYINPLIQVKWF